MNLLGIICEYNPFHNGHKYHIEESLRLSNAEGVVCAMSGNFVQRGEPAIIDKWARCDMALKNGVDVVLEIPTYFCLGHASTFAMSGIKLLEGFGGISTISFGSENGDLETLKRVSNKLTLNENEMNNRIAALSKEGQSWPMARQNAYNLLFKNCEEIEEEKECISKPNNILALEYLRHLNSNNTILPITIKRRGSSYNESVSNIEKYQSATGIRQEINSSREYKEFVPDNVEGIICEHFNMEMMENCFKLIKYKLIVTPSEILEQAPQGGEGLANRLKEKVIESYSLDELILKSKTKRYTYTHISRFLMQILLDINRKDFENANPEYIRILGLSERGREIVRKIKKDELNTLPIVTNINKEGQNRGDMFDKLINLDIKSADIYNLINGVNTYQNSDKVKSPKMFKFQ